MIEAGVPDCVSVLWFGIAAPTGTPQPIIDKLSRAANEALKSDEVVKALKAQTVEALGGTPDDFRRHMESRAEALDRRCHSSGAAKMSDQLAQVDFVRASHVIEMPVLAEDGGRRFEGYSGAAADRRGPGPGDLHRDVGRRAVEDRDGRGVRAARLVRAGAQYVLALGVHRPGAVR